MRFVSLHKFNKAKLQAAIRCVSMRLRAWSRPTLYLLLALAFAGCLPKRQSGAGINAPDPANTSNSIEGGDESAPSTPKNSNSIGGNGSGYSGDVIRGTLISYAVDAADPSLAVVLFKNTDDPNKKSFALVESGTVPELGGAFKVVAVGGTSVEAVESVTREDSVLAFNALSGSVLKVKLDEMSANASFKTSSGDFIDYSLPYWNAKCEFDHNNNYICSMPATGIEPF
jgi:hypothetical protein